MLHLVFYAISRYECLAKVLYSAIILDYCRASSEFLQTIIFLTEKQQRSGLLRLFFIYFFCSFLTIFMLKCHCQTALCSFASKVHVSSELTPLPPFSLRKWGHWWLRTVTARACPFEVPHKQGRTRLENTTEWGLCEWRVQMQSFDPRWKGEREITFHFSFQREGWCETEASVAPLVVLLVGVQAEVGEQVRVLLSYFCRKHQHSCGVNECPSSLARKTNLL